MRKYGTAYFGELEEKLTRRLPHIVLQPLFIPPRDFADGFVACCQRHDGQQGHDQREGAGYAPAGEDDAEVCCVPGEEHLMVSARGLLFLVDEGFWWG
jgi:hypothetical protein